MPGFTLCFTEWRIKQEDQKEDGADVNGTMDQRWRRTKICGVHMVKRQDCCHGGNEHRQWPPRRCTCPLFSIVLCCDIGGGCFLSYALFVALRRHRSVV